VAPIFEIPHRSVKLSSLEYSRLCLENVLFKMDRTMGHWYLYLLSEAVGHQWISSRKVYWWCSFLACWNLHWFTTSYKRGDNQKLLSTKPSRGVLFDNHTFQSTGALIPHTLFHWEAMNLPTAQRHEFADECFFGLWNDVFWHCQDAKGVGFETILT
jgi:hypothetical protein